MRFCAAGVMRCGSRSPTRTRRPARRESELLGRDSRKRATKVPFCVSDRTPSFMCYPRQSKTSGFILAHAGGLVVGPIRRSF